MDRPDENERADRRCPDDNAVAAFLAGSLTGLSRQRFEEHVDRCSRCAEVVAELGRLGPLPASGFETTLVDAGAQPVERSSYRRQGLQPGDVVARYRIDRMIGAGGMGVVQLAHDPVLHRSVALKLIRPDAWPRRDDQLAARERLLREARAMATLSHPNVVSVFDAGEHGEEIFLAMEYVDGETLDARLARATSGGEILRLFLEAGEGLAAAHGAGILHRDFKPQNVLVDRRGRVRVTDFGLARAVDARAEGAVTAPGALMGTPAYMAPEQLFGQPVDTRADQFAFCVALYEALFGERPFAAKSLDDLRWQMMNRTPRRPTDRRGLSAAQVDALMRGLKVPPSERFSSMFELLQALRTSVDSGELHVRIHMVAQGVFALGHLVWAAGVTVSACAGASRPGEAPTSSGEGGVESWAIAMVLGMLLVLGFSFAGVFWAPLNLVGLWRRRPWARMSTLIYGIAALFTVLGIPYGIYAIYSLTRPGVRAAFADSSRLSR
jgi:eukaryotic-like serine/threonine-protein kinase